MPAKTDLKTSVKQLRSKLDRADARAERLKSKVARLEKANTELEARVKELKKLSKRLEKAARQGETRAPAPTEVPTIVTAVATPVQSVSPDASWTVVRLREEARSRGLTGLSSKSKAQLLAALT